MNSNSKQTKFVFCIIFGACVVAFFIVFLPRLSPEQSHNKIFSFPDVRIIPNTMDDFRTYISDTLGFSMKIPREIDYYSSMEGPTTTTVLIRENQEEGTVSMSHELSEAEMERLRELIANYSLLTIHIKAVESKEEADAFALKLLQSEEAVVTSITPVSYMRDMYAAEFADKRTGEAYPISQFFIKKYNPTAKKVAVWTLGQDVRFVKTVPPDSLKQFDEDVYDSFAFTEK